MRRLAALAVILPLGLASALGCNEPVNRVKPGASAVDCGRVGGLVTTFELGNAATPEQRTPVVAKHRAACESANLTESEVACLGRATNTWSLKDCAPRMFPLNAPTLPAAGADCKLVVSRIRSAVVADLPADSGSAGLTTVDKMIAIMERACVEDPWPVSLRRCILDTSAGNMAAVQQCNGSMSQELQDKLAKRMAAEMPTIPTQ